MVHDFASKVNHCLLASLVLNKVDLLGEHSVSIDGCDAYGTPGVYHKGITNEYCLHVQHYL